MLRLPKISGREYRLVFVLVVVVHQISDYTRAINDSHL